MIEFNIYYVDYFDSFTDIDELKNAAKIWVKQDIERLEFRDNKIQELEEALLDIVGATANFGIIEGVSATCYYQACKKHRKLIQSIKNDT